ncbi:MAG: hypothetical protein L3J33_09910 [Rhodobacteraceae bacterium]|nr:hypothetical protein [Paracoccaceae bacterium]
MKFRLILPLLLTASISQAQTNPFIANETLSMTQSRLMEMPARTDDQNFALGAVHFLRGIEKTLQLRWQHNATLDDLDMPVLRLTVAPNPDAEPFPPELITTLFAGLLDDMEASRLALAAVNGDVALRINLSDLWFDVNMNGNRDAGESIMDIGAGAVMTQRQIGEFGDLPQNIKVQFDTADVAWLTAYTHLISGISEMVIAFDPTKAIETVMQSVNAMEQLRGSALVRNNFVSQNEVNWLDQFAMVYGALNMQPDATRTRAAHAHFLNMIAENKVFWADLALEDDNTLEWIPNENQQSALGIDMPVGTGVAWQAILADAEAILNGDLLINHWRVSPGAGINVKAMFMDPPPVDIVTWIQGSGLLPYMERGPIATSESINAFNRLVSGNSIGFSFMLN